MRARNTGKTSGARGMGRRGETRCVGGARAACDCLLSSPVLEKIRSAVGSAQLLMSQKVQQFYRLCQQNMVSVGSGARGQLWWGGESHTPNQ